MNDLPARRYTEKEVAQLLKRASELQRSPSAPSARGLTLAELEDIAREAGMEVGAVRRAAQELEEKGTGALLSKNFAGAPMRLVCERTLPFAVDEQTLGTVTLGTLLPLIESAFGGVGQVGHVPGTFTWHSSNPNSGRRMQVRLTTHAGEAHLRIEEAYGQLAGALFGGVLGGVGGGVGLGGGTAIGMAIGSVALAVVLPAAIIAGTYYGVRAGFGTYVRNRQRVIEQLANDIVTALQRSARARGTPNTSIIPSE